MAFKDFSTDQYGRLVKVNENIRMGTFQVVDSGELVHIRTMITIFNTAGLSGTETIKMHVYLKDYYQSEIATSNTINVSDITYDPLMHSWIGFVRFDFNNENINKKLTYYPSIEFTNNTFSGTHFFSVSYDYPAPVYSSANTRFYEYPLAHQIFLKRSR